MPVEFTPASTYLLNMAQELVKLYHPDLEEASIAFVFRSDAQKSNGKIIVGHAGKVAPMIQALLDEPYDFVIWIAEDAFNEMSQERQNALVDHELNHLYMDGDVPRLRHHDIEEFNCIYERYGAWSADLLSFVDKVERQLKLPGTEDTVTMTHDGKVVTVTGEQLERLANSMGR